MLKVNIWINVVPFMRWYILLSKDQIIEIQLPAQNYLPLSWIHKYKKSFGIQCWSNIVGILFERLM